MMKKAQLIHYAMAEVRTHNLCLRVFYMLDDGTLTRRATGRKVTV